MLIYKPFVHKLRLFPIIWLNPFEQFKHLLSIKWLCLLLISIGYQSNAQDLTIEPVSNYKADGTINIYGRGNLTPKIPYENITGNAFWQTEWQPATLFGRNSKERWEQVVKLNMATNEIYFKDKKGEEQVVNAGYVKQVLFHEPNDPAKITAVFLNEVQEPYVIKEKLAALLQVLNKGKYQLLKQDSRKLMEGDSLFGTLKRYYFKYETKYFIANNYVINPIKKLTKENVLEFAPTVAALQTWLTQNKIDFKKESDVIQYLKILNDTMTTQ